MSTDVKHKRYVQRFLNKWLENPRYKDWLQPLEDDETKCMCKYCYSQINAKVYDIERHLNTTKHQRILEILGEDDASDTRIYEKYSDWLIQMDDDETNCFCRYCKCNVSAKPLDIEEHRKTAKHKKSVKFHASQGKRIQDMQISDRISQCFVCKGSMDSSCEISFTNDDKLHQIVSEILNIDIKMDVKLEDHICILCLSQVEEYHKLQNQLDIVRSTLQEAYQNGKHQQEVVEIQVTSFKSDSSPSHVLYQDEHIILRKATEESIPSENEEQEIECLSRVLHTHSNFSPRKKKNLTDIREIHDKYGTGKFICDFCGKSFATKSGIFTHLQRHFEIKTSERKYQCNECEKYFLSSKTLAQHEKLHTGSYQCEKCGEWYPSRSQLKVHKNVHARPYVCRFCGKPFGTKAEIRNHERIHTGEKPFQCEHCHMSFAQRSNLSAHTKMKHLNEQNHKCDMCDRTFKRRRLLTYHIHAAHTGERPHKCPICHAGFVYPEHFKKHLRTHTGEKPFTCGICNRAFNSKENLKPHLFVHCQEKKQYECHTCGAGFMRKPLLLAHIKDHGHLSDYVIMNQPKLDGNVLEIEQTLMPYRQVEDDLLKLLE